MFFNIVYVTNARPNGIAHVVRASQGETNMHKEIPEIYLSVDENNKILNTLSPCKLAFECKQKRLSSETFWSMYETASKHDRMRCLLCVSGLKNVPKPFEGA